MAYWRGRVDETLDNILEELRALKAELRTYKESNEQRIEGVEAKVVAAQCPLKDACPARKRSVEPTNGNGNGNGDRYVSWKWIVQSLAVPVLIGFVVWFVTTVLPRISQLTPLK